ncbi:hypothetical protein [Bosea sp. (in: a-proteobacteria)]|uniref:hypothetical protein n=1 Tax=Bosea sp. (in: a-proteobacteria) TaxID=1871050 RepID=UPI002620E8E4|nr:hypothetical protein [Bosea sp. (in: a-proteobacteria)]MCO5089887.1 hypothetical protein [Bosea sp. (in: a-proteobacteria)]
MADFMRRTSLIPSSAYPTGSGRSFIVYGATTSIVTPGSYGTPSVGRSFQCQMLVETEATDAKGTADSWRVTRINRSGPC